MSLKLKIIKNICFNFVTYFFAHYVGGDAMNNNDNCAIRGRVDANVFSALKIILAKQNLTQQDLIERLINEYVLKNLHLAILKDEKNTGQK